MKKSLSGLRKKYPTIRFQDFVHLFDRIGPLDNLDGEGWSRLHLLLTEKEEQSLAQLKVEEQMLEEIRERIKANTPHLQLEIEVSPEMDREHVQAVLVYGFIRPTQQRMFVGRRGIDPRTVRQFVQNKHGIRINAREVEEVLYWLTRNGVVIGDKGLTLNVGMKKCTPQGKELLQKIIDFSRKA